ncbi:MAG TPA: pitrilysin family protein [Kofleriaceae bacterium]|nr:pitrilysin family protein [Kofleriaceae bacterium]
MLPDVAARTTRLANRLRVVTVDLPHLHTASLVLYVKVGSRLERAEDNGLSHFVEHMLFRGTERYPTSYDINFAFESLGGTLYAETGRDYSLFQVTLVPGLVADGLELFGELFTQPRFADLELERQLILEELNEDYDERGVEVNSADLARGLLFADHPLAQRIIGPPENVERFTDADVRRHFARYYCAANAILVAAGPVAHEPVLAAAERHLGRLPSGEEAQAVPARSDQQGARFQHVPDSGAQSSVEVLWRGVPETDPDYMAMVAMVRALDDGMSTRLHYRLCDQLGLAYSLNASVEPLHDVTVVEVTGATANAKVPELVARLLALASEVGADGIDEAELTKVKRRFRYDLLSSIDDANAMAGWFGGTALYYPPSTLEERAARMDAVTIDDVRRAATRVLAPDNLSVVVVGSLTRARLAELRQVVADYR